MLDESFDELLELLREVPDDQDIDAREHLTPVDQLWMTLRYLTGGYSFSELYRDCRHKIFTIAGLLLHVWKHQWKELWDKLKELCTTQPSKKEENVLVANDHAGQAPEVECTPVQHGVNEAGKWHGDNVEKTGTTHTSAVRRQWRGVNEHDR